MWSYILSPLPHPHPPFQLRFLLARHPELMGKDKTDTNSRVANHAGFSLHAGVMAEAHQREVAR